MRALPLVRSLWSDKRVQKVLSLVLWTVFLLVLRATGSGIAEGFAWAVPTGAIPLQTEATVRLATQPAMSKATEAYELALKADGNADTVRSEERAEGDVAFEAMLQVYAKLFFSRNWETALAKAHEAGRNTLLMKGTRAQARQAALDAMSQRR